MIVLLAGALLMAAPDAAFTPEQVVRIVADGLRSNNSPSPNAGIYTTYRFSSPANHAITAPYGNFLRVVKHPDFAPLLRASGQSFGPIYVTGRRARQTVRVNAQDGVVVVYEFVLTRQPGGACKDCWMLDGVRRR